MSELTTNLRTYLHQEAKEGLEHKLQGAIAECLKSDQARNCKTCIYDGRVDCIAALLKDMQIYLNSYTKH